jgi:hypothetical protein
MHRKVDNLVKERDVCLIKCVDNTISHCLMLQQQHYNEAFQSQTSWGRPSCTFVNAINDSLSVAYLMMQALNINSASFSGLRKDNVAFPMQPVPQRFAVCCYVSVVFFTITKTSNCMMLMLGIPSLPSSSRQIDPLFGTQTGFYLHLHDSASSDTLEFFLLCAYMSKGSNLRYTTTTTTTKPFSLKQVGVG